MSLAETHRGTFRRLPVFNEPRPRWVYEFAVEDICVSEREATEDVIPLPAAVDSKVLFLTSAKLPHSDRLQVNFGRFLQYLHAHMEGVWHVEHHEPKSQLVFDQVKHHTPENGPDKEKILMESAKLLSGIVQQPQDELVKVLRRVLLELHSRTAVAEATDVVLETFEGYVDRVDGETAHVQLKSREYGDVLYGTYPTSQLSAKGIEEQSRFLCETVKVDGTTRIDLRALPDVELTDEELPRSKKELIRLSHVTTPALSIDPPALEVHVLGGSRGESIVLKLPDGRWGVVDCYSESLSDLNANATARFLHGEGVARLFFVCLTHPHDDHYLGMAKLMEEFKPAEFWRFGCLSHEHVRRLLKYYELRAGAAKIEELSQSANELIDVFGKALEGAKNKTMDVCRANSRTNPHPKRSERPTAYKIECLSPTGRQIERYEGAIWECIGPDGRIAKKLSRSQHNDISLVLKITYGNTKIILGGDLEKTGWEEVVEDAGESDLSVCAVKVSHHGSENGY